MDYEQQVRRASDGDVKAFVNLTRQFQHMAFGAALALVNDFHQAEGLVQEAWRHGPRAPVELPSSILAMRKRQDD